MAFTLKLILLEKQTLGHNEGEWWVVPGSVHRGRKPSARKSGNGSAVSAQCTHMGLGERIQFKLVLEWVLVSVHMLICIQPQEPRVLEDMKLLMPALLRVHEGSQCPSATLLGHIQPLLLLYPTNTA